MALSWIHDISFHSVSYRMAQNTKNERTGNRTFEEASQDRLFIWVTV